MSGEFGLDFLRGGLLCDKSAKVFLEVDLVNCIRGGFEGCLIGVILCNEDNDESNLACCKVVLLAPFKLLAMLVDEELGEMSDCKDVDEFESDDNGEVEVFLFPVSIIEAVELKRGKT